MIGRASCPIVIMQHPRTPHNYEVPIEINEAVTTWFCCNQGNVNINSLIEKDKVKMDETVSIKFNADLTH